MTALQAMASGIGDAKRALITVFLRGAADGLNMVVPVEDDHYYRARPTISVAKKDAVKLGGVFGLHSKLAPLEPLYKEGELAIIHNAGSEDSTRSHFEAQDLMEHGGVAGGGWLGRFLRFRTNSNNGALSAVAIGTSVPECLGGAPSATVLNSLDDFSLGEGHSALAAQLGKLYAEERGPLAESGRDTLDALRRIEKLRGRKYHPERGADYGEADDFGQGLSQIAQLIKSGVGLEAASLDLGNWDSHFAQATLMEPLMSRLAKGLAAFHRDLGKAMETTTVVVMSEFGRRVYENTARGTDHGRGGIMFVLGGGVSGGRIIGDWPGLENEKLEAPGDVPVVNNYRNVLAPILSRHGVGQEMGRIFPNFEIEPLPLYL